MAQGKKTCKILKEIRRQIAEANGIEFVTSECRYKGDCLGSCPKCEAEVRYLEQQLRVRFIAGKAIALAGISAASLMFIPVTSEARTPQEEHCFLKGGKSDMTDSVIVSGVVLSGDTLPDGSISKEPLIGVSILNKRTSFGISTDVDGNFSLPVCVGDSLEVKYVGYESQTISVTDSDANIEIVLVPSNDVLDEVVAVAGMAPVSRNGKYNYASMAAAGLLDAGHYLDLNVIDENGNPIDCLDLFVVRVWINEDGEEKEEIISPRYVDEKHPSRIFWDYESGLGDNNGEPLNEATLRIEAYGYDDSVMINVNYPKHSIRKTIRFKRKME